MTASRIWAVAVTLCCSLLSAACSATLETNDGRPITGSKNGSSLEILVNIPLAEPDSAAITALALQSDYGFELLADWPIKAIGVHCFVYRVPSDRAIEPLLLRLEADRRVESAQSMHQFSVLAVAYDDALLGLQHGLRDIRAIPAHRWSTGREVRIGLVDTGVDVSHPDLVGQIEIAKNFIGDGRGDSVPEVHGTALAGVIAAHRRNGVGIVGVAPDAKLIALRGCWQEPYSRVGRCNSFTLARAINFALLHDVNVLNLSLRGPFDPLLARLIKAGITDGVAVVSAYEGRGPEVFPASVEGVIAVTANEDQASAGPSTTHKITAVKGPGTDILTTTPDEGYDFFSGSSLASAHVAGIVALLRERAPSLPPSDLKTILKGSMRAIDGGDGAEVVDACHALASLPNVATLDDRLPRTCQ